MDFRGVGKQMKSSEQIAKEISDRIVEYKALMVEHNNNQSAVDELESAIHELDHLLRWINE